MACFNGGDVRRRLYGDSLKGSRPGGTLLIKKIRTPLRGSRGGGDPLKIITERGFLEAISLFFVFLGGFLL